MDYSAEVHFSDSETEDQSHTKLTEVSGMHKYPCTLRKIPRYMSVYLQSSFLQREYLEMAASRTGKLLRENCTRRVPNSKRKEKFPLPPDTRPAQLDPMMKSETSAAIKAADKQLTKVQTLLLDSMAPLTAILEAHHKGVTLDHKEVLQVVKSGMHLIGNANAHFLIFLPIVGDDNNFKEAAPFLFGTEFAKKSKEMVEQVKAMRSTISKKQERKPPILNILSWLGCIAIKLKLN
jgi:hypothetical protein